MHQNTSSHQPGAGQSRPTPPKTANAKALRSPAATVPSGAARENFLHFLPIPDEIFHVGIYVVAAGYRIAPGDEDYFAHSATQPPFYQLKWEEGRILPDFAFLLIEAGSFVFESRHTGRVEICAGMGVMMFPGVWHRIRPIKNASWTQSWMAFNGEFAHLLLNQKFISPERAIIRPNHLQATQIALKQLLDRVHADPSSNSLHLSLQAVSVLTTLSEAPAESPKQKTPTAKKPADPVVAAALAFIWTSSHHLLSVKDVVDAVGVSRSTLERRMAEVRGRSVLDEIVECRLNRTTRLLRETELPLKTVAILAGFSSVQHMRRALVSRTGLLPGEYRNRNGLPQQSEIAPSSRKKSSGTHPGGK